MNLRLIPLLLLISVAAASATAALAQDKGNVDPKPLPALANPNDPKLGAKELFGRKVLPAATPTRVVGFYAKGYIAGAKALPIDGETWQVMRLSRNRNWAHPDLVALLERLSAKAHKDAGWPGILVGDMSQPRGGPMLTGHAGHQVGLDADVWLTPMPNRQLSRNEREEMSAVMMVRSDRLDAGPSRRDPGRGAGAECAAHLRQRRDQESAVPGSQGRPRLARQGAADVRPRLSFPYPHQMPRRRERMREPARTNGGRRLRHGRSRLLVQGFGAPSEAAGGAAEAKTADDARANAGRLPRHIGGTGCQAIAFRQWTILASGKCARMRCRDAVSARPPTGRRPNTIFSTSASRCVALPRRA